MRSTRRRSEKQGRWAEALACVFLQLKGYRLLARRYKAASGEIDLIMRRGDVTAFIEVKSRPTRDQGMWAVTPTQIKRIQAAARLWQARDRAAAQGICRFDIIVVCPWQLPYHVVNAFYGE